MKRTWNDSCKRSRKARSSFQVWYVLWQLVSCHSKLPSDMAKDQSRFPPRRDSPPPNCSTFGAPFAQNDSLYSVVNFWDRVLGPVNTKVVSSIPNFWGNVDDTGKERKTLPAGLRKHYGKAFGIVRTCDQVMLISI